MTLDLLHTSRIMTAALGIICISGASANADDLCVDFSGGGGTTVGKGYTVPENDSCTPFNGFEIDSPGHHGLDGGVTGTGCTALSGGALMLHLVYHNWRAPRGGGSWFETAVCRFRIGDGGTQLPADGFCRGTYLTSPDNHGHYPNPDHVEATVYRCEDHHVLEITGPPPQ